jgi:hypothetical protein
LLAVDGAPSRLINMYTHINAILLLIISLVNPIKGLHPTTFAAKKMTSQLPDKLIVAYTTNHCNDLNDMSKVTKVIEEGVNVLIWSFISFEVVKNNDNETNEVKGKEQQLRLNVSQNLDNYRKYREKLKSMGHDSIQHLVAFGGWNGPHLPSGFSGSELYEAFKSINTQNIVDGTNDDDDTIENEDDKNKYKSTLLWDGIDWDLEGHDNLKHPNNEFTVEELNQMGEFSQEAKNDGLLVSMAPPESYLDVTTNSFSRFVNLTYPDDDWHQDFEYHGWNVYAFVMAKYGHCIDFVFLQFYESYSHALYQTEKMGMSQSDFLVEYITSLSNNKFGYDVNFEDDPSVELKNQFVSLPLSKIVFGFANGWAFGSEKAIFFESSEVKKAYDHLKSINLAPRGCGYWVVEEEGKNGIYLTKDLNEILNGSGNENEKDQVILEIDCSSESKK